jgi:hypothetical protein
VTGRRTADVVAKTPMTLIAMFDQNFRRLERSQPIFSARIRSVLKERIARRKVESVDGANAGVRDG